MPKYENEKTAGVTMLCITEINKSETQLLRRVCEGMGRRTELNPN